MPGMNKGAKECKGGNCQHSDMLCSCSGHYMWLRWVIGILIIAGVFWLGIQIGSMRPSNEYGYDYYSPYQMMRSYPQMMQQWQYEQPNRYNMMQQRDNAFYKNSRQQQNVENLDQQAVPQNQPPQQQ